MMEDSTDTITTPQNDRIECPCRNFAAMSKIVDVLDSEDRMKSLLEWLAGGTDDIALSQNKLLSCGKRSRCRFRYGTSFAILNAIRDSCRPFLEPPAISTGTLTEEEKKEEAPKAPVTTYEEAFPVLTKSKVVGLPAATKPHPAASNILVPRKKVESKTAEPVNIVATKKKAKRRIRPQPAAANTPINSVWGQQSTDSTSTFDRNHGNTGNLPSQDPLSPGRKMNLTPTKKDGAINETTIEHQGNIATLSSQRFVTPVKKNRGSQPPLGAGSLNSAENQQSIDEICRKETQGFSTETNVAKKAPEEHLMRLIDIYMALIQNLLIPSTALELHLLLRMLMVDTEVCYKPLFDLDAYPFFEAVFCNPIRCKNFAKLALTKLNQVIQNLCTPLVKLFVRCEPFCRACPELAKDLSEVLEERIRHGLLADYSSEAVTGTHAILNIPFEEERDSRHNYRTQAEISVYKNREESRDSFLYELRAFMNVKGKLLKPQEMEKAQERVRQEARNIMNRLLSVNMVWFAQFFCELILQVGLSPVEETDQELLSIADKDTLQRLHKRFSSRSSNTNKSSKKLVLAQRTEASSVSPLTEAQLHFPGYQEFFFIFLHSANNYNFGTHLRAAFVATMINLSSDQSTNSLEKRLMNLQLFARFLGFLIFSPNWHGAEIDSAKIRPIVLADGLYQLESLGLSPMKMVEDAWVGGYTVSVVPWVTELLKMAKWDSLSQTSLTFRQLLANLRNIQSFVSSKDAIEVDRFGPSMQILSLCLETFFYEANGLAKLTSLPQASLSSVATVAADSLDRLSIGFSTAAFFASSPHIEDLSNLINGLCVSTVGKSPNKWRKLRPSVVSHGINLEASNLFPESPNKIGIPPPSDEWKSPKSVGWNGAFGSQTRNIQTKLVHAFFHQHRDVKEVCEFSVSQVLKNVSNQALSACIKPAFEEQKLRGDSSDHDFENAQEVALHSSQAFLKSLMETSLRKSLEVLGPPGLHPKVLDIAVFLSVTRGVHSGQALLHTLVLNESKTLRKSLEREKKKESQGKEVTFIEEQPASPRDKALQDLLSAVDALEHYLCSSSNKAVNDVALLASEADKLLKSFFTVLGCAMPTELSLRRLFESVFRLDCTSASFIEWCLGLGDQDCYSVLMPYLWFSIELSRLTLHGLKTLSECLQEEVLVQLLSKFCRCPAVSLDEIACLVMGMLESGIIEISHVRYLNSACVNDQVREIAGLVESGRRGK